MAKAAKKAATKKAADTKAPEAEVKTTSTSDAKTAPETAAQVEKAEEAKGATIILSNDHHNNFVRGAVQGKAFELAVGVKVDVTAGQLNALNDSSCVFETVSPSAGEGSDEGSSEPSTD